MKHFWCACLDCQHAWIAPFAEQFGVLFAGDEHGDSCPECGSPEVDVQSEYMGGGE